MCKVAKVVKVEKKRKRIFDEKSARTIIHYMKVFEKMGNVNDPFVKIAEILDNKYDNRQIGTHWRNYLDHKLSKLPLNEKEKKFIDDWVLLNRSEEGKIEWKTLRLDLEERYGLLHSENKVKNYWYSKNRGQRFENHAVLKPTKPTPHPFSIPFICNPITPITDFTPNTPTIVNYDQKNHPMLNRPPVVLLPEFKPEDPHFQVQI